MILVLLSHDQVWYTVDQQGCDSAVGMKPQADNSV